MQGKHVPPPRLTHECVDRQGPERQDKVQCTVLSEGRGQPVLPSTGCNPECLENSPADCFQQRAGGCPGWWRRSHRMRSSPPAHRLHLHWIPRHRYYPAAAYRTDDLIRLLADARIHLPQPGEGLRGLSCRLNRFGAYRLMDHNQPLYSIWRAHPPPHGGPPSLRTS